MMGYGFMISNEFLFHGHANGWQYYTFSFSYKISFVRKIGYYVEKFYVI